MLVRVIAASPAYTRPRKCYGAQEMVTSVLVLQPTLGACPPSSSWAWSSELKDFGISRQSNTGKIIERKGPNGLIHSTACWRGYIAVWEIRDNQIFLKDVKGCYEKLCEEDILAHWISSSPRNNNIFVGRCFYEPFCIVWMAFLSLHK